MSVQELLNARSLRHNDARVLDLVVQYGRPLLKVRPVPRIIIRGVDDVTRDCFWRQGRSALSLDVHFPTCVAVDREVLYVGGGKEPNYSIGVYQLNVYRTPQWLRTIRVDTTMGVIHAIAAGNGKIAVAAEGGVQILAEDGSHLFDVFRGVECSGICMSAERRTIFAVVDGSVKVYGLADGKFLHTVPGSPGGARHVGMCGSAIFVTAANTHRHPSNTFTLTMLDCETGNCEMLEQFSGEPLGLGVAMDKVLRTLT